MTPTAIDATVPLAAGLGIGVYVSRALGIDTQIIAWALVGGFFGAARAPRIDRQSRWLQSAEAVVQYFAASLLSALAAAVLGRYVKPDDVLLHSLIGAGLSFMFYPITSRLVKRAGDAVDAALQVRFGVPPPKEGDQPPQGGTQ